MKKKRRSHLIQSSIWAVSAFLLACSTVSQAPKVSEVRQESLLTLDEARVRSQQISHLAYDLFFDFTGTSDAYQGTAKIRFQFNEQARGVSADLRLDFSEGAISQFSLNGQPIAPERRFDSLRIPVAQLKSGENQIELSFSHAYSQDGRGLYRFVDPEDQRVYLFTDHEPFDANKSFPCFDQPDLKANFTVSVKAPPQWRVLSNAPSIQANSKQGIWKFKKSRKFSTYLFALAAGDYAEWKSSAGGIPLRLWARQSLAKHVKTEEWFPITQKGLSMYAQEFSLPYPYEKYDQIIAPDFQAGAMENPGAVLFSENYIARGETTRERKRSRSDVILHEMAHMWFGDWVTMKWWNDLWLNESFATFMSYEMMERLDPSTAAFASIRVKPDAYLEDQLQITHPIEGNVQDTNQAMGQFDAITYEKGSSTLKQLRAYLGAEKFRKGLVHYFKKYAESNASLNDFIAEMSAASGKDISLWQREWLQRSGFNSMTATSVCNEGQLVAVHFDQGSGPRPRLFKVRLFPSEKTFNIEMKAETFEWAPPAKTPCPLGMILNSGDLDFFRWLPNPTELKFLKESDEWIEGKFDRLMVSQAIYDSFIHHKIPAHEFLEYGLRQLIAEEDAGVQKQWVYRLWTDSDFDSEAAIESLPLEKREDLERRLEAILLQQWSVEKESDRGLFAMDFFLRIARSPYGLSKVDQVALGKIPSDWDRRWSAVRLICKRGVLTCQERVQYLRGLDTSERARKNAMIALAAFPDAESRNRWYQRVLSQEKNLPEFGAVTPLELASVAQSLGRDWQVSGFKKDISVLLKVSDSHYVKKILSEMTPLECRKGSSRNQEIREWALTLPAHLKKGLLRQWELAERCGSRVSQ